MSLIFSRLSLSIRMSRVLAGWFQLRYWAEASPKMYSSHYKVGFEKTGVLQHSRKLHGIEEAFSLKGIQVVEVLLRPVQEFYMKHHMYPFVAQYVQWPKTPFTS